MFSSDSLTEEVMSIARKVSKVPSDLQAINKKGNS
ncbi:MAG: hypothetical protein Ct9H90mP4_09450 [Gammaproteobacteria bacterium]|nr:MAG: hypothetical protein Ct9H90mP4_09450 [Gammaproteobacteria bacterium]